MKSITTFINENTNNNFNIYDLCEYLSSAYDLEHEYEADDFTENDIDDIKNQFDIDDIAEYHQVSKSVVKHLINSLTKKDFIDIIDRLNDIMDELRNDSDKYLVSKLEDIDGEYMGSMASMYIGDDKCYLSDYISAGLSWAEDAHDNEELDDDEYQDAIDHYENFKEFVDNYL